MTVYNDIAIPLGWPDKTAYGAERWMSMLKKCGIVKNLNFRVGHAAILLVEHRTGLVSYFDFGRYITPQGYGRARSQHFDPRLRIETRAVFDQQTSNIRNLAEILEELSTKEAATHGGGRLLLSLAYGICFRKAADYAEHLVQLGPIPYGALARNNNSCSRYVAQILTHGMVPGDPRIRKILYPECLKASPTSNVVNAAGGNILCFEQGRLSHLKMNRRDSLRYQWSLLQENLRGATAAELAPDDCLGFINEPTRPLSLPREAQWLGGIGEGMWFHLETHPPLADGYIVSCYTAEGTIAYRYRTICARKGFDVNKPYRFTAQANGNHYAVLQENKEFLFEKVSLVDNIMQYKSIG